MNVEVPTGVTEAEADEIASIATAAEEEIRPLLPGLPDPLHLDVEIGGWLVIPVTGDGGLSVSPGRVTWAVDNTRDGGIVGVARMHLRNTLFHELHHQARGLFFEDRGVGSWMDAVVGEGLATAFARDAAGDDAPWGQYPDNVDEWVRELRDLPADADYFKWMMFNSEDGRQWIGYRAGTFIADRAVAASGRSTAELATTPTNEILRLAGY